MVPLNQRNAERRLNGVALYNSRVSVGLNESLSQPRMR